MGWLSDKAIAWVLGLIADQLRQWPGAGAVARAYLAGGTPEQLVSMYATVCLPQGAQNALHTIDDALDIYRAEPLAQSLDVTVGPVNLAAALTTVAQRVLGK